MQHLTVKHIWTLMNWIDQAVPRYSYSLTGLYMYDFPRDDWEFRTNSEVAEVASKTLSSGSLDLWDDYPKMLQNLNTQCQELAYCINGDWHPGNVGFINGRMVLIDMGDALFIRI